VLKSEFDLASILDAYNKYASAISVLTDKRFFGGSFDLLSQVSRGSHLPTLCKDFIIDPYQCYEARLAGAKAALLIVKILDRDLLDTLYQCLSGLGMSAVVEVQTVEEMEIASSCNPEIVLINNRDLSTFEIDLSTTTRLARVAPANAVIISASGIETGADVKALSSSVSSFLIGTSIMQSKDIKAKLKELLNVEACKH
jgi:indole-3-glycerol phosphate synthase